MKKVFCVFLAVLLSASVLSGCMFLNRNLANNDEESIATINEKEYAELVKNEVSDLIEKDNKPYGGGVVLTGVHNKEFFEYFDFKSNDLYLRESVLNRLVDYGYTGSYGKTTRAFNQQPSNEELELLWKCTDSSVADSEFEEYRSQLLDLVSQPVSAFCGYYSCEEGQRTCDAWIYFGFVYDKISKLSEDQFNELSEKSYEEFKTFMLEDNPAADRMELLSYPENHDIGLFYEIYLRCFKDVKEEYEGLSADQEKKIYLLRLMSEVQDDRHYGFCFSSAYANLEAQYAGLISPDDQKLTLQKAEEIIEANQGKDDPVNVILQEFLKVQKYPDWHIAGDPVGLEKASSWNETLILIGSYYEFITPGENGTTDSIAVINHEGIVYHQYDAEGKLLTETFLLADFNKGLYDLNTYSEQETSCHHG